MLAQSRSLLPASSLLLQRWEKAAELCLRNAAIPGMRPGWEAEIRGRKAGSIGEKKELSSGAQHRQRCLRGRADEG